jgi:hypothetical protein
VGDQVPVAARAAWGRCSRCSWSSTAIVINSAPIWSAPPITPSRPRESVHPRPLPSWTGSLDGCSRSTCKARSAENIFVPLNLLLSHYYFFLAVENESELARWGRAAKAPFGTNAKGFIPGLLRLAKGEGKVGEGIYFFECLWFVW